MLFDVKFLHLLPGASGQIGTAIFPESSVEPEVCPLKPSDDNSKTASKIPSDNKFKTDSWVEVSGWIFGGKHSWMSSIDTCFSLFAVSGQKQLSIFTKNVKYC